jgi:hypothetical protein
MTGPGMAPLPSRLDYPPGGAARSAWKPQPGPGYVQWDSPEGRPLPVCDHRWAMPEPFEYVEFPFLKH